MPIRNLAELNAALVAFDGVRDTLLADNNTGDISPQDVRDVFSSLQSIVSDVITSYGIQAFTTVSDSDININLVADDINNNFVRAPVGAFSQNYNLPPLAGVRPGLTLAIVNELNFPRTITPDGGDQIVGRDTIPLAGFWQIVADPANNRWLSDFSPLDDDIALSPTGETSDTKILIPDTLGGVGWVERHRNAVMTGGVCPSVAVSGVPVKYACFDTSVQETANVIETDVGNNRLTAEKAGTNTYQILFQAGYTFNNNALVNFALYVGGAPTIWHATSAGRGAGKEVSTSFFALVQADQGDAIEIWVDGDAGTLEPLNSGILGELYS